MKPRSELDKLLVRVAYGAVDDSGGLAPIPEGRWEELLRHIHTQNLAGLTRAAVASGTLTLKPDEAAELRNVHVDEMIRTIGLERALLRIVAAAEAEHIELVVLKGPAIAHCFYPDPSARAFSDIDLLVHGSDWRRACGVLETLGFHRALPEPRAGFDERFGKAAVHANEEKLLVDLHRTLVLGPFGLWIQPNELFERTTTFSLAGRTLRRLDDTTLLVHACMHASLGWTPPLLMPLRDVAQVASVGRIDWAVFRELTERWRLTVVVQHAFRTARGYGLALPPDAEAFLGQRVRRREARALGSYITGRRARGGMELSSIRAIPGARAKASYVRALLFPGREFLAARSAKGRRPSYLRRWTVPLRWLGRRRG